MINKVCLTFLIFVLAIPFAKVSAIDIGDSAPPISLFKLESNKYFRSKEYLGKKNIVVSFHLVCACAKEIRISQNGK